MNYEINNKVFYTESEAREFSKALAARGCAGAWRKTYKQVTHEYIGDGMTIQLSRSAVRALYE